MIIWRTCLAIGPEIRKLNRGLRLENLHMKRQIIFGAAFLSALAHTLLFTAAKADERTLIILDGSGSMWGQIDGIPKLDIARQTLSEVLPTLSADKEIGLMAYGHRKKGECNDIEMIVSPAKGAGDAITKAASNMRFLGKTPLSAAVRQGAEALRYTEDKATIILITDGLETCNADPCALATELEKSGIDFTTHVVGFGLKEGEGKQIACIAENTGGIFIEANDSSALKEAMTQTIAKAPAPKPEPTPAPEPKLEATVTHKGTPAIGQFFAVEWSGPSEKNDYVDIAPLGERGTAGSVSSFYTRNSPPSELRAPKNPGQYELRYVHVGKSGPSIIGRSPITIIDAAASLQVSGDAIAADRVTVGFTGPLNKGDYIDIVLPDDIKKFSGELSYSYVEKGNPAQMRAPGKLGDYIVRYVTEGGDGRRMLTSAPLKVAAAEAELDFTGEVEAGNSLEVKFKGPVDGQHYIDIVPENYAKFSNELAYAYVAKAEEGNVVKLNVPGKEGVYQVRYVLEAPGGRRALISKTLMVKAALAELSFAAEIMAGKDLDLTFKGPVSDGHYIDIVPEGYKEFNNELAYAYVSSANEGNTVILNTPGKVGRYQIRYVLEAAGGRRSILSKPLTVLPADIKLETSGIAAMQTDIEVKWTGPNGSGDYLDIVPVGQTAADGELAFAYTVNAEDGISVMKTPNEPGDYLIRYVIEGGGGRVIAASVPLKVQ